MAKNHQRLVLHRRGGAVEVCAWEIFTSKHQQKAKYYTETETSTKQCPLANINHPTIEYTKKKPQVSTFPRGATAPSMPSICNTVTACSRHQYHQNERDRYPVHSAFMHFVQFSEESEIIYPTPTWLAVFRKRGGVLFFLWRRSEIIIIIIIIIIKTRCSLCV
jgi:hypothetical protein